MDAPLPKVIASSRGGSVVRGGASSVAHGKEKAEQKHRKTHIGQVLSVFVWGALVKYGLTGTTGYEQQLETYLAPYVQHVAVILLSFFFILSVLIFLWPLLRGIRAYLFAGVLGLIALGVGFVAGYEFLGHIELGAVLLLLAIILWLVGLTRANRARTRSKTDRNSS